MNGPDHGAGSALINDVSEHAIAQDVDFIYRDFTLMDQRVCLAQRLNYFATCTCDFELDDFTLLSGDLFKRSKQLCFSSSIEPNASIQITEKALPSKLVHPLPYILNRLACRSVTYPNLVCFDRRNIICTRMGPIRWDPQWDLNPWQDP